MLITISDVLSADHRSLLGGFIPELIWTDGRKTAGRMARQVKHNSQADLTTPIGRKVEDILHQVLLSHPVLKMAAHPRQFSKLLVSKTEAGGGYGMHVDNAFMPAGDDTIRTDLSFTLFLSSPQEYEGGELCIEHAGHSVSLKPQAGDMVLYPSSSLHQVKDVISGTRLACVGWIESRVKRADDREILFDAANLKAELSRHHAPQSPEMLMAAKILANLLRRFG